MTGTPSTSPQVLELQSGALRLALRPDLGACIAGLWLGGLPVLRSSDPAVLPASRPSGCYPLVPYSNRIGGRRFTWAGQTWTTEPNFDASPHSVHGVGWLRPWAVQSISDTEAVLTQAHAADAHWPFAFNAVQTFRLTPQALELEFAVTNRADIAAPVGFGWHPYFPKRARSRLHVELTHRWDSEADELPVHRVAQHGIDADVAQLQYDNCFEGWSGAARIRDEQLSLRLTSSLPYLVVFTPQHRDYYCVEPVSHLSNAIQQADPLAHGLRSVAPGETTGGWMKLEIAQVH